MNVGINLNRKSILISEIFLVIACVTLGFGLVMPAITIQPNFGDITPWVLLFDPRLGSASSYSVLSSIEVLIASGEVMVGVLLLFFSLLFPVAKLSALWHLCEQDNNPTWFKVHRRLLMFSKYSMLDVFVLALIVVAVKGLPGGSEVHLGAGVVFFAISTILTLLVSLRFTFAQK